MEKFRSWFEVFMGAVVLSGFMLFALAWMIVMG